MSVEDVTEIIPRLFLGNVRASKDKNFIRSKNIQVVFNCTKNLEFSPIIKIKYRIPIEDNLAEEEIAFKIMSEYLDGKTILVHCMAGMQRSACAVAFFLIAFLRMRALDAMKMIKEKRLIAFSPRANFGRAIDYFDRKFHGEILPEVKKIPTDALFYKKE
jgi:predicted protein tyrosine phosphatase